MSITIKVWETDKFILAVKVGKCISIQGYISRELCDLALDGYLKQNKYQVSYVVMSNSGIEQIKRIINAFLEV